MRRRAHGAPDPGPDGALRAPVAAAGGPLSADTVRWEVVTASGEIDLYTAPELRDRLLETVAAGHRFIIVDLSDVTFMDSTGLTVLVTTYKRLVTAGGRLRVAGARSATRATLVMSGLDLVFETCPDVDTARTLGEG